MFTAQTLAIGSISASFYGGNLSGMKTRHMELRDRATFSGL